MVTAETAGLERRMAGQPTLKGLLNFYGLDRIRSIRVKFATGDVNTVNGVKLPDKWDYGIGKVYLAFVGSNTTGYTAELDVANECIDLYAAGGVRYATSPLPAALNDKYVDLVLIGTESGA